MELPSFLQLKNNCTKGTEGMPQYRLAVLGDSATQMLAVALKGYAYEQGFALDIWEADYDQIEVQTVDAQSELYAAKPQSILLYMCAEELYTAFCKTTAAMRENFAEQTFERIRSYWTSIRGSCGATVLQFTFVEQNDGVFGNYATQVQSSFLYQVKKLNLLLMEEAAKSGSVFLLDLNQLYFAIGIPFVRDSKLWYSSKLAVSLPTLPAVAKQVVDVLQAIRGCVKKCVVLDLDNTLWGGVVGDDGLEGIEVGELGKGPVFSAFQMWLKQLEERGILLTVCSKNNEETAKEPFIKHPEMVLRLEDFALFIANWEDKASNIRQIQRTLNIGMDSMVFLDDNPFERRLVRELIPEITVPDLPEDPAEYVAFLQRENLFETASFSAEDGNRTRQYQAEEERRELQEHYTDFDSYLKELGMTATVGPFAPFFYPRIAQLTQRSNQFNLRTVRYTEAEIATIAEDPHYLTLQFQLKDRFGDHGLISVIILEKQEERTLFIDTWLMSCRVLKRGMEEFIMNRVMELARKEGYDTVVGEYLPTAKNKMVSDIYAKMGFETQRNNLFRVDVDAFKRIKTHVQEAANDQN